MSEDLGIHNDGAGKGDSPRNLGKNFRDNYDLIDWGHPSQPVPPTDITEEEEEKKSV